MGRRGRRLREVRMSVLRLGIALASLALTSLVVSAQGVRIGGFGISVGIPTQPLFHERPDRVERYRVPERTERTQRRHRTDDDDEVKTAKKAPASEDSKSENENSSIVSIGGDQPAKTDTAALTSENSTIAIASFPASADPVKTEETGKAVATCQRFYPSVGQMLSVPCE
jgi:hypothetical protein